MAEFSGDHARLSDRILFGLELALEQEDLEIAELLNNALEMSMTRNSGGGEFIERRGYPLEVENVIERFRALKAKK